MTKTDDEYMATAMLLGMYNSKDTQSFWRYCNGFEVHLDRDTLLPLSRIEALRRAGSYWRDKADERAGE